MFNIPDEWKHGKTTEAPVSSIVSLIRRRASADPDATALVTATQKLSFQEIDILAQKIAKLLHGKIQKHRSSKPEGGARETIESKKKLERIIVICCDHEIWTPVSVLGCLYAGFIYAPISPLEPVHRLVEIMRMLQPEIIIFGNEDEAHKFTGMTTVPYLSANTLKHRISAVSLVDYTSTQKEFEDLSRPCWIHMTSGTTGIPKGVMVDHKAVVQRCIYKAEILDYEPYSIVLLATPFTFDPYATDLLAALSAGASVASYRGMDVLSNFSGIIEEASVTHVCTTPSLWSTVRPSTPTSKCLRSMKVLSLLGERMPKNILFEWSRSKKVRLFNMYGVTEATDTQLTCEVSSQNEDLKSPSCVGHPDANVHVELLNHTNSERVRNKNFVPTLINRLGDIGEILIGGPTLAMGYYKDPSKTARQFISLDIDSEGSRRLYRTGDLGFWRPDGKLELLGRIDNQVKILGKRVELEEISSCAMIHPCVRIAVAVLAKNSRQQDEDEDIKESRAGKTSEAKDTGKQIVLFAEPNFKHRVSQGSLDLKYSSKYGVMESESMNETLGDVYLGLEVALRSWCEERLSRHLVPNSVIFFNQNQLPHTHTGKVDRQKLIEIAQKKPVRLRNIEPPLDKVESIVAQAWAAELFPVSEQDYVTEETGRQKNAAQLFLIQIDRKANFFELGGDSLSALRICKALAENMGESSNVDHKFGVIKGAFNVKELLTRPRLDQYADYLRKNGFLEDGSDKFVTDEMKDSIFRMKKLSKLRKKDPDEASIKHDTLLNIGLTGCVKLDWESGIRSILDAKADVNGGINRNNPGWSPLHYAARKGHVDIVKILVESKANVNSITSNRESPLHIAARAGPNGSSTLKYLLSSAKANGLAKDSNAQTFVHTAARTGNSDALSIAIQCFQPNLANKLVSCFDRWGRTPLHWAVLNSHMATVRLLLKWGAKPNLKLKASVARSRTRLPVESTAELARRVHGEKSKFEDICLSYEVALGKK